MDKESCDRHCNSIHRVSSHWLHHRAYRETFTKRITSNNSKITHTTPSAPCPVTNTSTSFCIIGEDGKPYYISIEGWYVSTIEEVKHALLSIAKSDTSTWPLDGLYLWLKLKTNMHIDPVYTHLEVKVGELYRYLYCFEPLHPVKLYNDTYLLPIRVTFSDDCVKETLRVIGSKSIRISFGGDIFFRADIPSPSARFRVLSVEGFCKNYTCTYNVSFELVNAYLVLYYYYDDETGTKSYADFPEREIGFYTLENGKINFMLYCSGVTFGCASLYDDFVSEILPILPNSAFDVWKEAGYSYIGTVIPPGNFTLRIKGKCAPMPLPFIYGNTTYIGTPWGGVKIESKVKIKVDDVNATVEDGELIVYGVHVTIENHGKTPIVIPFWEEAYTREIPLFVGKIGSEKVVFGVREEDINGNACTGDVFHDYFGLIINPGERVEVNLVPAVFKGTLDNKIILPLSNINGAVILELVYNPTGEAVKYPFLVTK